jgi:peptidoglycan/xylan/chitin deacetylase (PgdA/CDA1 family)
MALYLVFAVAAVGLVGMVAPIGILAAYVGAWAVLIGVSWRFNHLLGHDGPFLHGAGMIASIVGLRIFVLPNWLGNMLWVVLYLLIIPRPLVALVRWIEPRVIFCNIKQPKRGGKPKIALTIDDCPYLGNKNKPRKQGESRIAEILDVLKENNAKATFMVMSHEDGQEWYGKLLTRAVAEGHELGNHGTVDETAAALPTSGDDSFEEHFNHCDQLLRKLQGDRPMKWFRPGGGMWTKPMLDLVSRAGYKTVLTNVCQIGDPYTSRYSFFTGFTALWLLLRARMASPGAIMLVHDRVFTPDVLRLCLPGIATHFDVVTLSELFPEAR